MERVVSPEERMRRAEEIYYRRRSQGVRVSTDSVNVGKSVKLSLTQKMIIQILICVLIYSTLWLLKGYNNVFSENIINQTRNILSYDVNFPKMYNQCMEYFNNNFNNIIKINENDANSVENDEMIQEGTGENETIQEIINEENAETEENTQTEENIKTDENIQTDGNSNEGVNIQLNENNSEANNEENSISQNNTNDGTQKAKSDSENMAQMEEDAEYIKHNYNFIHPLQGTITSRFGSREETEIISAFHQGIDISAVAGTAIHAAVDGTVVAASYAGDYGNHIKIQNGEVLTVYAHCSELEVEVGSYIEQGQEIGKVGATGKVTGPHLHFEIRRDGRYVNPEMILAF